MESMLIEKSTWAKIVNYFKQKDSMNAADKLQISEVVSSIEKHIKMGGKAYVVDDEDGNKELGRIFQSRGELWLMQTREDTER